MPREGPLRLMQGDITEQAVDAIVNAANSTLMGGGGVDGAIHRRGGSAILAECKRLRATVLPEGLPTGEAVVTTAGLLPARHVIHTVGPVWSGGAAGEPDLLARAYRSSLECARREGLRTIAFPSISTGAYGYPTAAAAGIALQTVRAFLEGNRAAFDEVRFVLFSDRDLRIYERALERISGDVRIE
jgi:O-acetyl-ADP-ribose deacetylase (regulator of RNase III)